MARSSVVEGRAQREAARQNHARAQIGEGSLLRAVSRNKATSGKLGRSVFPIELGGLHNKRLIPTGRISPRSRTPREVALPLLLSILGSRPAV